MGNANEFGMAIRKRRKQLGLTQKELAMTCGTRLRFIVDLGNDKPTCQLGKTILARHALGLSIQIKLLAGEGLKERRTSSY